MMAVRYNRSSEDEYIPLKELRYSHPQQVIDFMVPKIVFGPRRKPDSGRD